MKYDYFQIFVTVGLAVLGWIVAHFFTVRRDLASKRRELSTQHLIDAYRVLTNEVSHRELNPTRSLQVENILSDIQLFGSIKQVDLARTLADEVAAGKVFELDPLINSLRDDLRHQLGLPQVKGNVKWLRFEGTSKDRKCAGQRGRS